MAVALAGNYSSNSTPSLGTSCRTCSTKKTKKKKKKKKKKKDPKRWGLLTDENFKGELLGREGGSTPKWERWRCGGESEKGSVLCSRWCLPPPSSVTATSGPWLWCTSFLFIRKVCGQKRTLIRRLICNSGRTAGLGLGGTCLSVVTF